MSHGHDITPSRARKEYPFLVDETAEDDYAALIEGGTSCLWHRLAEQRDLPR